MLHKLLIVAAVAVTVGVSIQCQNGTAHMCDVKVFPVVVEKGFTTRRSETTYVEIVTGDSM